MTFVNHGCLYADDDWIVVLDYFEEMHQDSNATTITPTHIVAPCAQNKRKRDDSGITLDDL
jgi:hypothetical protein